MAIDFYAIDRNSKLGGSFIDAITTLRRAKERVSELKAVKDHMHDGTNYAMVKTIFGAPNLNGDTDSQTGKKISDALDLLDTQLNTAAINAITDRVR